MRKCPFCAEEIQDAAIKCRYCGSTVERQITLGEKLTAEFNSPLRTNLVWYYLLGNERMGPVETQGLLTTLLAQPDPHIVQVWREGLVGWEAAEVQPEFRDKLPPRSSRLPPPPPANVQVRTSCPPVSTTTTATGTAATTIATVKPEDGPVGVGGWLLLLCIGLTIVGPLVNILFALNVAQSGQPGATVGAVVQIGLAAWSFFAGFSLWTRAPNAVRMANIFMIAYLVVSVVATGTILMTSDKFNVTDAALSDLARVAVGTFIWTRYLAKSKRVRATFAPAI